MAQKKKKAVQPQKQNRLSAASTEELTCILAKRGLVVRKKEEPNNIPDKTCLAEPERAKDKPRLQVIFDKLKESNGYLEDSVIVLEHTAKNLFGYLNDYKENSEVDATNANQHFALQEEVRTILTDRLARVTNALSDFIG